MHCPLLASSVLLAFVAISGTISAQNQPTQSVVPSPDLTADYPLDRAGIFIQGMSWQEIKGQTPSKSRAAHGIAASLSYGLVPAKIVAEYEGEHAPTQIDAGQPIVCICHILSLPGQPVIVRLHPKKASRELDGGKMIVYPVVGGSKMADANKSDLFPVDLTHPDPQVWLVRPQSKLAPGEYALMLGTQNVIVYPFTVSTSSMGSSQSK
jgi:hypothetical protein